MRPQSCKAKGRRLQQRIAADILAAFPSLSDGDAVSTSMGAGGEDVRLSPAARRVLPLSLECKNTQRLSIWSHLQQAEANAPAGATPCVVFTRNRSPTFAVLPWPVLLKLYSDAAGREGGGGVEGGGAERGGVEGVGVERGGAEGSEGEAARAPPEREAQELPPRVVSLLHELVRALRA